MKALIFFLITSQIAHAVDWRGNNWAMGCDFRGNDLSSVRVPGDQCGGTCAGTNDCTHFTWTSYEGGTCWMKRGTVSRNNAFDTDDKSIVCGIFEEKMGGNRGGGIQWNGNWAMGCDFRGNDLSNAQIRGEDCGGRCASTPGCTHFTWTSHNGGTCWMKQGSVSKDNAFSNADKSVVCGLIDGQPSGGGRDRLYNILATRHVNGGGDACALPSANYVVNLPFALGSVAELGYMSFKPDLCGHVLNIDCGNGAMDIIITNSNYGGGMDLYSDATWPRATNNKPPGEARCSAQLVNKNSIAGSSYQCFYKPGTGTNNPWYRNVGLLNTEGKLVTGATVDGRSGQHRGDNPYYAFDLGRAIDANEEITFNFDDGSSHKVRFSQCVDTGSEQQWR
uniref:Apple domain-containing protein n=1 Tax=Romanomermis culicivorax TaxID=13658 RepID=A0A915JBS5_ROMCU